MIRSVLVLGGGSAGYLAALTLKCRLPDLSVTLVPSQGPDDMLFGEGCTPTLGCHLHHYCGLEMDTFYRMVQPMWKIGTRLEWGPRPYYNSVFGLELDGWSNLLPHATGYYLKNQAAFEDTGIQSRLMREGKIWLRAEDGTPRIVADEFAYQLDIAKLASYLEQMALQRGVVVLPHASAEVTRNEQGVTGVRTEAGELTTADLYIDTTGLVLEQALGEPFSSYDDSLFCDRAVLGSWQRGGEALQPYVTSQTMAAGWCWQVEHEHRPSRGYVYASSFISDHDAEAEFRAHNPHITATSVVRWRSGRQARFWVKNVVGIGNAIAYVEPLQDTALAFCCVACQMLADALEDGVSSLSNNALRTFNKQLGLGHESIRDFLALHYRYNRRLDTPFWRDCQARVAIHGAGPLVEFYQEHGPGASLRNLLGERICRHEFGLEGYLALLVGQCVPYESEERPTDSDRHIWAIVQQAFRHRVAGALTVAEALDLVRSAGWVWPRGLYDRPRCMRQ